MPFIFHVLILLFPAVASGEVHFCSGIWRSQPCLQRTAAPAIQAAAPGRAAEKLRIAETLERFAGRVEAEFGHTDFEAQGVRAFCIQEQTSVDECRARALKADRALMGFYQTSMKLRQRERELDQRQEEMALRRAKLLQGAGKARNKTRKNGR